MLEHTTSPIYSSPDASALSGPDSADVAALAGLLDLLDGPTTNEQRARYLLTCDWFVTEGADVARRAAEDDALFWARWRAAQHGLEDA